MSTPTVTRTVIPIIATSRSISSQSLTFTSPLSTVASSSTVAAAASSTGSGLTVTPSTTSSATQGGTSLSSQSTTGFGSLSISNGPTIISFFGSTSPTFSASTTQTSNASSTTFMETSSSPTATNAPPSIASTLITRPSSTSSSPNSATSPIPSPTAGTSNTPSTATLVVLGVGACLCLICFVTLLYLVITLCTRRPRPARRPSIDFSCVGKEVGWKVWRSNNMSKGKYEVVAEVGGYGRPMTGVVELVEVNIGRVGSQSLAGTRNLAKFSETRSG